MSPITVRDDTRTDETGVIARTGIRGTIPAQIPTPTSRSDDPQFIRRPVR